MFKKLFWPMQHCARSIHALLSRKPACTERAWGLHGPKYSFIRQFYTSFQCYIQLLGLLPIPVPQHTSIEVAAINSYSLQYLSWVSKLECFSDVCTALDELSPLALAVIVKINILVKVMAKVGSTH